MISTQRDQSVKLQRQLSRWKLHWSGYWANSDDRLQVAQLAHEWGDRVLHQFQL